MTFLKDTRCIFVVYGRETRSNGRTNEDDVILLERILHVRFHFSTNWNTLAKQRHALQMDC